MPAKDIYHDAVKNALIKDGWIITADPYFIIYKKLKLIADIGAERPFAAEREGNKIVVEVKSFLNPSFIYDLEQALGQYILYRNFLQRTAPERQLYLAMTQRVYQVNFDEIIQIVVDENQLKLIIVDSDREVITKWIN
ncbi:XisH family protein [Floridanema aerugineum]|uniref:XisH family protein n=1 Tax=Floridaenema aerugineum BLCC-F46 TaxID=3153654 RepID=A0ABV4X7I8_9CYAN